MGTTVLKLAYLNIGSTGHCCLRAVHRAINCPGPIRAVELHACVKEPDLDFRKKGITRSCHLLICTQGAWALGSSKERKNVRKQVLI